MSQPDPSETARLVFSALADKRWADAAALVHPEAAEAFKRGSIRSAIDEEESRTSRLRGPDDPNWIPPVLGPPLYHAHYGVDSVEQLERLPALEAIARYAASEAPDGPFSRPLDDAGRPIPHDSYTVDFTVIGYVPNGDETAYVVYRRTNRVGERETVSIEVMTLRLSGDEWRTMDFKHFANFLHPWPRG